MKTRITKGNSLTINDISDQVAGIYPRVMTEGLADAGGLELRLTGLAG